MSQENTVTTITFNANQIMYLPTDTRCPQCGSKGVSNQRGEWFIPFVDFYGSQLQKWIGHLGYLQFACGNQCHPHGALRVARLGDAVVPLPFVGWPEARSAGKRPDEINANRIGMAIQFLGQHADTEAIGGKDALAHIVYAVASGQMSPEVALARIRQQADLRQVNVPHAHMSQPMKPMVVRE